MLEDSLAASDIETQNPKPETRNPKPWIQVAGLDCIMGGLNFFLSLYISVRLRRRLTFYLHDQYLSHKQFYYHMTQTQQLDNPDQRIQNDSAQVPNHKP